MNRSLLNLHTNLLLFIYRTTKHSSTGYSHHEILFSSNPTPSIVGIHSHLDLLKNLQSKLAQLKELVDSNIVKSDSIFINQASHFSSYSQELGFVE